MYSKSKYVSLEPHISNTRMSRTEALPMYLCLCHLAAMHDGPHDLELHISERVNNMSILTIIDLGTYLQ